MNPNVSSSGTSLRRAKQFARGGLCPRAATAAYAPGDGGGASNFSLFQPQRQACMGRYVFAAFPKTVSGARANSGVQASAFYLRVWTIPQRCPACL